MTTTAQQGDAARSSEGGGGALEERPISESGSEDARAEAEPPGLEPASEPAPEPGGRAGARADAAPPELDALPINDPKALAEGTLAQLRANIRHPRPPPRKGRWLTSFVWGLAQPLLGLRVLLAHGDLFVRAIGPLVVLLVVCWLLADGADAVGPLPWLSAYYATLVGAAQVSPIFFTKNFAKLAAESRRHLEVTRHEPYLRSYGQAVREAVLQLLIVGAGVAPLVGVARMTPLVGGVIAALVGWIWLAHWIVVEALDSARTLPPGEDMESIERRHALLDPPWYVAPMTWRLRGIWALLRSPLSVWLGFVQRLSRRWRGEVLVVETRPAIAAGFGVGASLLLAIPVINLLMRPAVVIAAAHVLGRLEEELELPEEEQGEQGEAEEDVSAKQEAAGEVEEQAAREAKILPSESAGAEP